MGRKSYHHGDLRNALVEATTRLIEQKGPLTFTLAEAARLAGVSAAAPYRHFAGRDELLAEVARQGFVEFSDRLDAAFGDGRPSPLGAFIRMGHAYLRFAQDRQGLYMAMFEAGASYPANSPTGIAAARAHRILVAGSAALFAHLPAAERPPATMVANHLWAQSHGIVELFTRGNAAGRSPISAQDMLESALLIYLRGLGVIPH